MSTQALSIGRVVNVQVNLQPLASHRRRFGILLIAGPSDVIDPAERIRRYTGLESVASDFGFEAPEYQAAELYFSQTPRPSEVHIGRWCREATPAMLKGAIVPEADAMASSWRHITKGAFGLSINGSHKYFINLDFSACTNMNGVVAVIDAELATEGAACVWDERCFVVTTLSTGAACLLGFATPGIDPDEDIAAKACLTEHAGLIILPGQAPETAKEAAVALADKSGDWYGLVFVTGTTLPDERLSVSEHLEVAAFIEGCSKSRIYGVTATDSRTLESVWQADVASELKALKRKRTMVAYSRNPYAVVSALGRAFTVNFNANKSTITLKFKQLLGVVAEGLTETQAETLAAKRCNVFAQYDNDTAIYQEGVMSGDAYFDEIHGLDWLQNAVQTKVWNLLYQSKTKIPQTDSGVNQILTCISKVMAEAVNNGLVAPGIWNADGFGQLKRGDLLPKGYYLYASPVADQPQSEREQRKCVPIQCAVKLAGAIHFVDVLIDVNR